MADSATNKKKLIVVCPLKFERDLLARHGIKDTADLHVCGMGADATRRWVETLTNVDGRLIVMVGIAGGLSAHATPGAAFVIKEVRDARAGGATYKVDFDCVGSLREKCATAIVCMADRPISTIADKSLLCKEIGADLVDMESLAFAEAMTKRGLRWLVVRGVSDGPDDMFPAEVVHFIDDKGGTRYGTAIKYIARRPSLLKELLHLRRRSEEAMREAAGLVRDIFDAHAS